MSNGDTSNGDSPDGTDSAVPLLAARDLTKTHGRTEALRGASAELRRRRDPRRHRGQRQREVHAAALPGRDRAPGRRAR